MNKLDIFCFTSVARTRSFSLTARELLISQQAVSKHIKNMEDELGYQLFFRDSSPVELTKAGEFLLEYFTLRKRIVEDIKSGFEKKKPQHSLNIGFSQWIGNLPLVRESVKKYNALHPELEFHLLNLESEELINAASRHEADLLVTSRYMSRYMPPSWKSVPITKQNLYIIKSKGSTYIHDQLSLYPFYAVTAGESSPEAVKLRVLNTCKKLGFTPQNIITCMNMGTVMLNAILSGGITIGSYPPDRGIGKEYMFEKTDLEAEIMLSTPWQGASEHTEDLVSFIFSEMGEAYHE